MTVRFPFQCRICEQKLLVKVQAGYVEKSHVKLACPNCSIILEGELIQDPPKVHVSFQNAKQIENDNLPEGIPVIFISTELPIPKESFKQFGSNALTINPYLALGTTLGYEKMELFKHRYLNFVPILESKINSLENIISLCQHEKWELAVTEARQNFSDNIPFLERKLGGNEVNAFYTLSLILKYLVFCAIPRNYEESYTNRLLLRGTMNKLQKSKDVLEHLFDKLSLYYDFNREFIVGAKILLRYLKNIPSYAPVICLTYNGFEEQFRDGYKITTFSFDDLKEDYKDSFELVSRSSILFIAFSNYALYQNEELFLGKRVTSLGGYYNLTNGKKKEVLSEYRLLNKYFRFLLDNQLRNGIGHAKTEFLDIEQIVRYYPYSDRSKMNKYKEKSLVDFAYQTLLLKLTITDLIVFLGKWRYRMAT